jgi:hypothetical protein
MDRPQKITLGEMRASGVRGLLVYCADYKCAHAIKFIAGRFLAFGRAVRDVPTISSASWMAAPPSA